MEDIETFFGKLREIHESVNDEQSNENISGLSTAAYVKILERKVCILEDIVDTTGALAELNCSTLSNDVNHAKSVSIGIQTDFDSSSHSNVVYDSLHDVPQSFMVTDSDGVVELPESLLSININYGFENAEPTTVYAQKPGSKISSSGGSKWTNGRAARRHVMVMCYIRPIARKDFELSQSQRRIRVPRARHVTKARCSQVLQESSH